MLYVSHSINAMIHSSLLCPGKKYIGIYGDLVNFVQHT